MSRKRDTAQNVSQRPPWSCQARRVIFNTRVMLPLGRTITAKSPPRRPHVRCSVGKNWGWPATTTCASGFARFECLSRALEGPAHVVSSSANRLAAAQGSLIILSPTDRRWPTMANIDGRDAAGALAKSGWHVGGTSVHCSLQQQDEARRIAATRLLLTGHAGRWAAGHMLGVNARLLCCCHAASCQAVWFPVEPADGPPRCRLART